MSLHSPLDEAARQRAVDHSRYAAVKGHRDLDNIVDLLASSYKAPIAAFSVIDQAKQVLVSRIGIDVDDTLREDAFCAIAIHRPGEMLLVPDAQKDARFARYKPVTDPPHIRFYAGKPVLSHDGYALGALCIADVVPRSATFDPTQLAMFASRIESLLWR